MNSELVQNAHTRLHNQGGRMTAQRRLILESLEAMEGHPTAEELYALAVQADPKLHLSTVYRTLRWLEQEGLVSARRFSEERRQDRFDPVLPSQHQHFLCRICKSVIEFDPAAIAVIQAEFEHDSGARVESASLVFYGLCPSCARNNEDV